MEEEEEMAVGVCDTGVVSKAAPRKDVDGRRKSPVDEGYVACLALGWERARADAGTRKAQQSAVEAGSAKG